MSLNLRDYQHDAIQKLREGFAKGYKKQMLASPTGSGKTEIAIAMLDAAGKKGTRSAMILDRIVLCDQTSKRLQSYNIDHGVLQSGHWRYRPYENIQVCSAQTLERRDDFPELKLLIIDEAHTTRAKTIEYINANPDVMVVGLSATPFTKGLGKVYDNVISTVTTRQLVDQGVLCPLKVFIAKEIDMDGAKKVAGEWSQDEVTTRGLKITGDIVAEWISKTQEVYGGPKKTIVFCAGVAHGEDLVKKFKEAGFNFISISYREDDDYKKKVIEDFSKPDTEIHGLIATDILTKGFDVPDVMVGVSARPFSKSLSSHIQQMGRVMRGYEDKKFALWLDHCIASGQKVLTHRGLVKIEEILISDKIWDGHDFVSHKGVVSRGKRPVITYCGLTATPDHLVYTTDEGWCSLGYCAEKQKAIVTTGIGRQKIWQRDGYFTRCGLVGRSSTQIHACSLRMHDLWLSVNNFFVKLRGWTHKRLQAMQSTKASSRMAECKNISHEIPMQQQEQSTVSKLWWQGNPIQIRFSDFLRSLDSTELGLLAGAQGYGIGPHKQRWALRAWQHSLGKEGNQYQQSANVKMDSSDAQIQTRASRNSIFGRILAILVERWSKFRPNRSKVSQTFTETQRQVWDILDCGPRNSFTCEGLLVHNSGNYLRFREDWDDVFENGVTELDDSKEKAKKEPTKKEKEEAKCPRCHAFWAFSDNICGACGYIRERKNKVAAVAGEMMELQASSTGLQKQEFWSMIQWYVRNSGWSEKRALATYRERFGVWPKGLSDKPIPPNAECTKYLNKKIRAYLYRMGKVR